jgi:hypothetical protein
MRVTRLLDLSAIKMDRWPLNQDTLRLINFLQQNPLAHLNPIKVQDMGNGLFKIKDGRHRVLAYKMMGRLKIEAKYGVKTQKACPCKRGRQDQCPDVGVENAEKEESAERVRYLAAKGDSYKVNHHEGYPGQAEAPTQAPEER